MDAQLAKKFVTFSMDRWVIISSQDAVLRQLNPVYTLKLNFCKLLYRLLCLYFLGGFFLSSYLTRMFTIHVSKVVNGLLTITYETLVSPTARFGVLVKALATRWKSAGSRFDHVNEFF
jgi:hypothetical protein